jgi:hypothetical protein
VGQGEVIIAITSSTPTPVCTGAKAVLIVNGYFPPRPACHFVAFSAAILTERIVYDKRHYSVRPAIRSIDQAVPQLFLRQHDVTFELATPLPRTLLGTDICNKPYGNLLCVATGWSSCKNCTAVLVEQICTGLTDFGGMELGVEFYRSTWGIFKIS